MALRLGIRGRHKVKDNKGIAFYRDMTRGRSYCIAGNFGEVFDLANSV